LIFLEARSPILHEQLRPRLLDGKREPVETSFNDFDDVGFKVMSKLETPNIVKVNISMRNVQQLRRLGSDIILNRLFPGLETTPEDGYDYALEFNCDNISNPESFLNAISELKRHISVGPLELACRNLLEKGSRTPSVVAVDYRKTETIYVCSGGADLKVVVIFLVDFADATDKAIARVFLQEFVEAQRTVRQAPPVSYSRDPPGELASLNLGAKCAEAAGFLSFALEERHIAGGRMDNAITVLVGFRNYLHYHIQCSKTYLLMRMRKRAAGWLQVLNRAVPEVETEKKTSAGKTFVRK